MLKQESKIIESKHSTMLATDSNKNNETTTTNKQQQKPKSKIKRMILRKHKL